MLVYHVPKQSKRGKTEKSPGSKVERLFLLVAYKQAPSTFLFNLVLGG